MKRVLVVYYSRKGHVKKIAERIARERGADLCRVETDEKTKGILGFWWCGRFGMHRWEMPILPVAANPEDYERVILVSPVWVFSVCAPMRAFLRQAKGRIRRAEYVLCHFSPGSRYPATVRAMDEALGIRHERFTSVACPWGIELLRREYPCP